MLTAQWSFHVLDSHEGPARNPSSGPVDTTGAAVIVFVIKRKPLWFSPIEYFWRGAMMIMMMLMILASLGGIIIGRFVTSSVEMARLPPRSPYVRDAVKTRRFEVESSHRNIDLLFK